MSRASRNLCLLGAIATLLVTAVLWVGRQDYVRDPPTLTTLDPGSITHVTLHIPSIQPQVFTRHGGLWQRTRPTPARADATRVERLTRLAASPVIRWLALADVVPAKVGLAQPSATLELDGARLEYGGLTAIGGLRYVRAGNQVALVPRQYSPQIALTQSAKRP